MKVIQFEDVTKTFVLQESHAVKDYVLGVAGKRPKSRTIRAIDGLTFSVDSGESVALLGPNGSGKSTSLKLLSGVLQPSAGVIRAKGRIAPLLELGSGFHPDLTGRENIFLNGGILGISRRELKRVFDEIVDFAGVHDFIDTPVKYYSSGMAVRLGFAVAINIQPEILLLDEVLAVGDSDFQVKSRRRMEEFKASGTTIILVTHNLKLATDFCDRGLVLEHGKLVFDGDTNELRSLDRQE
jgi:ABC-2 type transport system ATP-binding protein